MPQVNDESLFLVFTKRLNDLSLRYMITGSVAGIIYGEPRLTHDVDVVVELGVFDLARFVGLFPAEEFYCPPQEVLTVEINRSQRGHFNLIHLESGFKADIYPLGNDPLHLWGIAKAKKIQVKDQTLWLAPPEYVILRKLQFCKEGGSQKHIRDISSMLKVSAEQINIQDLEQHLEQWGLMDIWNQIKN